MDARNRLLHHLIVSSTTFVLVFTFILTGTIERAFGRTAFILFFMTLSIGPLMRIWRPASKLLPIRGELGTWFAITALTHGGMMISKGGLSILGADGFGLATLAGLVALFWALLLASTSSGRAVAFLGPDNWKWLHGFSYVIFYLVALHIVYFLFISSSASEEPSRFIILAMILIIPILHITGFIKRIIEYNRNKDEQK